MPGVLKIAALLLAQAVTSLSRSELRWEFARITVAVTLLAVAIVALALFVFRRRTRDPTLIYFGVFCILYAVRLLALRQSFHELFGAPQTFWDYADWFI